MRAWTLCVLLPLACSSQQRAETERASAVFACEVAVLTPLLPSATDAEQLVVDVVTGQVILPLALARLGMANADIQKVIGDFNLCFAGEGDLAPIPNELST